MSILWDAKLKWVKGSSWAGVGGVHEKYVNKKLSKILISLKRHKAYELFIERQPCSCVKLTIFAFRKRTSSPHVLSLYLHPNCYPGMSIPYKE